MSTEKNTNDEDYLSEIMANMKKTVSAKKNNTKWRTPN